MSGRDYWLVQLRVPGTSGHRAVCAHSPAFFYGSLSSIFKKDQDREGDLTAFSAVHRHESRLLRGPHSAMGQKTSQGRASPQGPGKDALLQGEEEGKPFSLWKQNRHFLRPIKAEFINSLPTCSPEIIDGSSPSRTSVRSMSPGSTQMDEESQNWQKWVNIKFYFNLFQR